MPDMGFGEFILAQIHRFNAVLGKTLDDFTYLLRAIFG